MEHMIGTKKGGTNIIAVDNRNRMKSNAQLIQEIAYPT